jgi:hypothetical protein
MSLGAARGTDGSLFDPRVLIGLVAIAVACLVGVVYFGALGDFDSRMGRVGNNSFSTSAVGHMAFTELLERRGYSVVRSRADSLAKASGGAILRLEPNVNELEQVLAAEDGASFGRGRVMLVLPKRFGLVDPFERDRARRVGLLSTRAAQEIVAVMGLRATVSRPESDPTWRENAFGTEPTLSDPQLLQLDPDDGLDPLVSGPAGTLIAAGFVNGQLLMVISDPDILSNHGIDDGDNAALAVAALEHILAPGSVVVVDETVHGFEIEKDFWRLAFSPPYVGIALAGAVLLGVMVWRALVRFGSPAMSPRPFGSGKSALIRNTRDLLLFGGYGADGLARYRDAVLRDVSERANIRRRDQALDMEALARLRGGIGAEALRAALDAVDRALATPRDSRAAAAAARALSQWKKDILHGR